MFGGEEFYNKTLKRDKVKRELCEEHNIEIVYFSNANIEYPYEVIETYEDLLRKITIFSKKNIKQ